MPSNTPVRRQSIEQADHISGILPKVLSVRPDISQTLLKDVAICPRKYFYRHRLQLVPRGYKSAPSLGTMFHIACDMHYAGKSQTEAHEAVHTYVDGVIAKLREDGTSDGIEQVVARVESDCAMALVLSDIYVLRWPLPSHQKPVLIEKTLRVELEKATQGGAGGKTPAVYFRGTLDLILFDSKADGFWLMDHKTTSLDPSTYMQTLGWDLQSRTYRLAFEKWVQSGYAGGDPDARSLHKTYGKKRLLGFIHNIVQKPTIRLKQSQTYEDYLEECKEWLSGTGRHAKRAEQLAANPAMRRTATWFAEPADNPEIGLLLVEASRWGKELPVISNFPRTGQAAGHCTSLFGSPCEYLSLCANAPGNWSEIVARGYEVQEQTDHVRPAIGLKPRN